MGLGPAVCETCELLADYHPNKENPNRQGEWLCPKCGFWCNSHFFMYSKDDQEMIHLASIIFKENQCRT